MKDEFTEKIVDTIYSLYNFLKTLVGGVCIILLIMAGYHLMTAGGDEKKISNAKSMFVWAVVGLIFILVLDVFIKFICQITGATESEICKKFK
jgi:hypothetical protein